MTTIVSFCGGPSVGKTTVSALVFSWLKMYGCSVEMAREYVKKWAWQGRKIVSIDELYFVGRQIHEESQYFDKVDYLVSDKPLVMDIFYSRKYASAIVATGVEAAVRAYYEEVRSLGHCHINVLLRRSQPYDPRGRYEDEATAIGMDSKLPALVSELGLSHETIGTSLLEVWNFCERLVGGDGTFSRRLVKQILDTHSPDQISGSSDSLPSPEVGSPSPANPRSPG